jgi:hypothetical protein
VYSVGRNIGLGIVIVAFVPMILTAGPAVDFPLPSVGTTIPEVAIPTATHQLRFKAIHKAGNLPLGQVRTTVAISSTPVSLTGTKVPVTVGMFLRPF